MVHPGRLSGQWNLPEAHQRDVHSACNQPRNQFASIAPRTRQGIGRYQDVHRTLRVTAETALYACFRDSTTILKAMNPSGKHFPAFVSFALEFTQRDATARERTFWVLRPFRA